MEQEQPQESIGSIASHRKKQLELDLFNVINDFEEETELSVDSISIRQSIHNGRRHVFSLEIEVSV